MKPIHDPKAGPLRCVALMSGSGTNLRRLLELQESLFQKEGRSPFVFTVIFTDNAQSAAFQIGKDFDIPVVCHDIRGFYAKRGRPLRDLAIREVFDADTVQMLKPYGAKLAVYAGYMSIVTPPIIDAFLGVNVHPADLSVLDEQGERRFTGAHAVHDAIAAGEEAIYSTTHFVEEKVDGGRLVLISPPVPVELTDEERAALDRRETLNAVGDRHQDRLKEQGDWVVFPQTLEAIARGRIAEDEQGRLYYDGEAIPQGQRLS